MPTILDISSLRFGTKLGFPLELPDSIRLLKDGEKVQPGQCVMRIPTPQHGDQRVVWDSSDYLQIADAKATFDKLVLQGLTPYRVGIDGAATSEVMDEFDPFSEEIIFVAHHLLVGG
jgi:hypothetical protein